jgi:hypothetical protein
LHPSVSSVPIDEDKEITIIVAKYVIFNAVPMMTADPGIRALKGVVLRQLACWHFGFESRGGMDVCLL